MSPRRRAQLALGALILAVPLAGVASPAYADATTGSVSGTLTTDGQVRTYYEVSLTDTSGFYQDTFVQDSGTYEFADVPPGEYTVEYQVDSVQQWYHGKTTQAAADPVTVVAGQNTEITDSTLPTGVLAGTLTDSAGNPLADAFVSANDTVRGLHTFGSTDPDGHYSLRALPGDYAIGFFAQQYPQVYLHDPGSPDQSTFTVTAGNTTTVDEQLPPTGSMSGHFVDENGQPEANVFVSAWESIGDGSGASATTDENGDYTIPYLFTGAGYVVSFESPDWVQYAYGARLQSDATAFTITAGSNTVVNDHALGTGAISVTAKDSVTGAGIADFCANVGPQSACSNGTGHATLSGLQEGAQSVYVYDVDNRYVPRSDLAVTVVAGQTVPVVATLTPGAFIETVVKDASTGAPVQNVCVVAYGGTSFVAVDGYGYCSDSQGKVRIGPIDAGSYRLYATAHAFQTSGSYGDQWVGATGGVGVMADASATKVKRGKEVNGPSILLDHPGTITGVITDARTGQPVPNAQVGNAAMEPGAGSTYRSASTDSTGHYTLTGLGPYAWPLSVTSEALPWQWTGGVANRTRATTVTVHAGATVTFNDTLADGVTLSGSVHGADGASFTAGRVIAYNVGTGDPIGAAELGSDGTYRLPLIGSQNVKLRFEGYQPKEIDGWYGGTGLANATPVNVPAHKNLSVNITIG